uniref:Outer capsid protein VP5 n=1 Tax=Umatilla virus TaxID=40060 RepID=A0A5S9EEY3_9REOV|nr:VP5 [Umatilla virus]
MGKISNAISKFGTGIKRAAKSDITKTILQAAASGVTRFAESEVGQRTIEGLVQGTAQTVLTGGSLGENVKRAVVTNVLGTHDIVTDPLDPVKHQMAAQLDEIKDKVESDKLRAEMATVVKSKLTPINTELTKIENHLKQVHNNDKIERNEIEILESAIKALSHVVEIDQKGLKRLRHVLQKEERNRSSEEKAILNAMATNYESLRSMIARERDGLIEEAVEQTLDISGEIAEHLAAEVPLVGETLATGIATGRGVVQMYRLGQLIAEMGNLPMDHVVLPAITQGSLEVMLTTDDSLEEQHLMQILESKIEHVDSIKREVDHLSENVVPIITTAAHQESLRLGGKGTTIPQTVKAALHIPKKSRPAIHFYTAPWDSDYVVMFHVVGPYHSGESFLLCVDLATDYISRYDIYVPGHHASNPRIQKDVMTLQMAMDEFLREASQVGGSTQIHQERLARGVGQKAIYIGSQPYTSFYSSMYRNAEKLVREREVQMHVFRGPIALQRRTLLNVLMHGIVIINDNIREGRAFNRD